MKKKILIGVGILVIEAVFVFNIRIVSDEADGITTLNSLVKTALADEEGQNCPGGSCAFTKYLLNGEVDWKCTACCPYGKDPQCDNEGCICH